jgi:Uma2 family endonuclease
MATNFEIQTPVGNQSVFPLEPIEYDSNGEIIYPEQRETDMGETLLHYALASYIWNALTHFFNEREDVLVAANMNLYYEEGNPYKWFAPDVLVALGVRNHNQKVYKLWQELIFPQVIFEIASDRTYKHDWHVEKFRFYEQLGAEEYYLLDAERLYLPSPLMAFRRQNGRLAQVEIEKDRIYSPHLGLEIVQTEQSFRFFNQANQKFLRTLEEAERANAEIERQAQAEIERLKAEIEELKARS